LPDPFDFERNGQRMLLFTPTRHTAIIDFLHDFKMSREMRMSMREWSRKGRCPK
jgi:hypothetical protein